MEYSLRSVDHPEFSESHWERFYALLVALRARGLGNPPPANWEALKARVMGRVGARDGFRQWVLFEGERPTGWVVLVPRGKTPDGRGVAVLNFSFEPELDVTQVAPQIAAKLVGVLAEEGCEVVHAMSPETHLDCLRQAWGGTILSRMVRYRLDRERANRALIEQWLAEYPERFPELRMDVFDELPDEHIDAWLTTFRQFTEDMPNEGGPSMPFAMTREEVGRLKEFRRKNRQFLYTAALFDSNGQMIGHSNLQTPTYPPVEWHQAMTGVARPWRGRGLSKWLKAALFVQTGLDFPESRYIVTEMRSVNEPILTVNRAMGYEKTGEGYEWSIEVEALKQFARFHP